MEAPRFQEKYFPWSNLHSIGSASFGVIFISHFQFSADLLVLLVIKNAYKA
jgi:hypothetical protein